jgi:hypothetical protein
VKLKNKLNLWLRPRMPGDSSEPPEELEATADVTFHFNGEDDGVKLAISILQAWTISDHAIAIQADVDLENLDEIVNAMQDALPEVSDGERADKERDVDLWAEFHAAGFTDIWYAHPGPHCYEDYQLGRSMDNFGPRWHAGVWTGPEHDLVCVRTCSTNKEANRYLSPGGWSPEEAVRRALAKRRELGGGGGGGT